MKIYNLDSLIQLYDLMISWGGGTLFFSREYLKFSSSDSISRTDNRIWVQMKIVRQNACTGIGLSTYLIYLPCLSIHPSVRPSVRPSIHSSVCSSIHPPINPSIHSLFHPPMHPSIHACIHSSIHLSIHQRHLVLLSSASGNRRSGKLDWIQRQLEKDVFVRLHL